MTHNQSGVIEKVDTTRLIISYSDTRAQKDQYNKIFDAILNDREPPVSGTDSLKSLAFVSALYKSAETGQPVSVEELLRQYSGDLQESVGFRGSYVTRRVVTVLSSVQNSECG